MVVDCRRGVQVVLREGSVSGIVRLILEMFILCFSVVPRAEVESAGFRRCSLGAEARQREVCSIA